MQGIIFAFLGLLLFITCGESDRQHSDATAKIGLEKQTKLPQNYKDFHSQNGVLYLLKKRYSGIVFTLNKNSDTLELAYYKEGLLHGQYKAWYANHQLKERRYYQNGKKHGKQIAFWNNGNKRFEFEAREDVYEGELREWTINGKLFHLAHFKNGQEEGVQKLWYANGKIRANYIIKNGKRYGLLGTKNCVNVSDSIFLRK